MRRKIPSTAALAAFEAAARHQSFTQAADELAVTQSAICRQIAGLEDFLGVKLFRRSKRGVLLTEAGAGYSRSVRARLDEVERDTLELMAKGSAGGTLELGVVPTFASKWLMPRLWRFLHDHPEIDARVSAAMKVADFSAEGVDVAIRLSKGDHPDLYVEKLFDDSVLPLCSPSGDQSPHFLLYGKQEKEMRQRRGVTEREEIAQRVADAVERALACTPPPKEDAKAAA